MIRLFDVPFAADRVETRHRVRVGSDVSVAALRQRFDVVILAYGATRPRAVGSLRGPDVHQALDVLSTANTIGSRAPARLLRGPHVAIIGGGNVALDVVAAVARGRVVSRDGEPLRRIDVVSRSAVHRPAFTLSALHEVNELDEIELTTDPAEPPPAGSTDALQRKLAAVPTLADATGDARKIHIHLSFANEITDLIVSGNRIRAVAAGGRRFVADSVVCAVEFTSTVLPGVPLSVDGTVSNRGGRVVSPNTGVPVDGLYVTGWAKRGARGGLGDNHFCTVETVDRIVSDMATTQS